MMEPTASEKDILELVSQYEKANNTLLSKRMSTSTEYTHHLCKTLVKNGYLGQIGSGLYALTLKGEAFVERMKNK